MIKKIISRSHLVYLRIRNPRYIDYYRAVMDYRAKKDPKQAIGGKWDEVGPHQLHFLKTQGLKPESKMLDVGCGSLRGGIHFISFLDKGNYTGMDISANLLKVAKKHLQEHDLESKSPRLVQTNDMHFDEFDNDKFDFLNAQSVLSHMPREDIVEMFSNLHKVMHETSVFIATYKELKEGKTDYHSSVNELNFHYTLEMLQEIADEAGFKAEKIHDPDMSRTQSILRITKSV